MTGSHTPDREDLGAPIQQHDTDREAHPEGMDGPGPLEQERFALTERVSSEEPSHPLRVGGRHPDLQDEAARSLEADRSHRATLAGIADIRSAWAGQDSNPRHEG